MRHAACTCSCRQWSRIATSRSFQSETVPQTFQKDKAHAPSMHNSNDFPQRRRFHSRFQLGRLPGTNAVCRQITQYLRPAFSNGCHAQGPEGRSPPASGTALVHRRCSSPSTCGLHQTTADIRLHFANPQHSSGATCVKTFVQLKAHSIQIISQPSHYSTHQASVCCPVPVRRQWRPG